MPFPPPKILEGMCVWVDDLMWFCAVLSQQGQENSHGCRGGACSGLLRLDSQVRLDLFCIITGEAKKAMPSLRFVALQQECNVI